MKKTLAASGVFISLMVGAGFASGRELLTFFARSGAIGILGFFISCVILALCGLAVMDITHRLRITGYSEFMALILGKRFSVVMVFVVNVFIFVMMAVMFSGFGEALSDSFRFNYSAGVIILAGLCFITFLFDLKGIVRVSSVLAPILVVGGFFLGLFLIFTDTSPAFLRAGGVSFVFVWPAAIYASYNLLTGVSVLSSLGGGLPSRKAAKRAALISGIVIFALGLSFLLPIVVNFDALQNLPLPLLALVERGGTGLQAVYLIVFVAAVFTTAVSSGFAVIEWLSGLTKKFLPKTAVKLIITIGGLFLAHIGFDTLVDRAYPFFGYIGLFQIAAILLFYLTKCDIIEQKKCGGEWSS